MSLLLEMPATKEITNWFCNCEAMLERTSAVILGFTVIKITSHFFAKSIVSNFSAARFSAALINRKV
jgi:hypothetical protein